MKNHSTSIGLFIIEDFIFLVKKSFLEPLFTLFPLFPLFPRHLNHGFERMPHDGP